MDISLKWTPSAGPKGAKAKTVDPGDLDPPYQTWRLFETEIFTSTGLYVTFKLSDFF